MSPAVPTPVARGAVDTGVIPGTEVTPDGIDPEALIRSSSFCAMVHASHHLSREIAPELAALGLNPTLYLVLGQVFAAPGCTPAELARRCAMSPQHLASTLEMAEARGLVRRGGERGKGRPTSVEILPAGTALLAAGWPVVHGAGADRLTAAQHTALQHLLDQIRGMGGAADDLVVLVGDDGHDVGTHPRATVHTTDTPLHRAFSTYLRRADGKVLITRRALHKRTWPGVWSNSACGHLAPGETALEAAARRVPEELGVAPRGLTVALPDFRYRAVDASGIVENEVCPVLIGQIDDAVAANPDEVSGQEWVSWGTLRELARDAPFLLSPWCVLQIEQLGDRPW